MLKGFISVPKFYSSSARMANAGLFVLNHPSRISSLLPAIWDKVEDTLYIHLDTELNLSKANRLLSEIYSQTSALGKIIDVRVLLSTIKDHTSPIHTRGKVGVVLFDENCCTTEMNNFVVSRVTNATISCQVLNLNDIVGSCNKIPGVHLENVGLCLEKKIYSNVVLGGTFDRLHSGHKILLSEAVLRCSKTLTVGVTDTSMLKSKKLWELIQPCEKRMCNVEDFLKDVDPSLQYNIVPISDPYGPTKHDPSFELLVVSSETLNGGKMVNEMRAKNGLPMLDVHVVDLLENPNFPTELEMCEAKISSSNYRLKLLGSRINKPEEKPGLPRYPYILGFTGGIASGKSTMCKRIEKLGAGVIDCDGLAHQLYRKNEPCYLRIVEDFGRLILDLDGEIDRKKLGAIVFENKAKLQLLNSIMWPHILEAAKAESKKLYSQGCNVIIWDAAVLIPANWDQHCHEVWLCIVSPDVAVKRLQERNQLSHNEAQTRINAQPSNLELVKRAHVVFCTEWDRTFSQYQAEKAWHELQDYLQSEKEL